MTVGALGLDRESLSTCVSCGLCLPHCPTFRVTGEEAYSPRGRIDAMRTIESGDLDVDDEFVDFVETCVQCRGCEPACPSGVQFGSLMEATRSALAAEGSIVPWWQRFGYSVLGHHRVLLAGSTALSIAQRLHLVPARLGLGRIPLRRPPQIVSTSTPEDTEVWLFTGCVMDAWQRGTHQSTAELVTAAGATYSVQGDGGACCGALHVHAGLHDEAVRLASRVIESMPGDGPVIVNSAGCGAAMKEYGDLIGTAESRRFAARIVDVSEWLAPRVDQLPEYRGERQRVIVQDPCHLRHVQQAHMPTRVLLGHVADVVELDDEGLCCGAGGAYSALQPELSVQIRALKLAAIGRASRAADANVVASANPGCSMYLSAAPNAAEYVIRHPVDIVAAALRATPGGL